MGALCNGFFFSVQFALFKVKKFCALTSDVSCCNTFHLLVVFFVCSHIQKSMSKALSPSDIRQYYWTISVPSKKNEKEEMSALTVGAVAGALALSVAQRLSSSSLNANQATNASLEQGKNVGILVMEVYTPYTQPLFGISLPYNPSLH